MSKSINIKATLLYYVVTLILWCLPFVGACQLLFEIDCHVYNKKGQPLSNVAVKVFTLPDHELTSFGVTDSLGQYSFKIVSKQYQINFTHAGFESANLKWSSDSNHTVKVVLIDSIDKLPDVLVNSYAHVIQQKADRTIYNVENNIMVDGLTAWATLKQVPLIKIDYQNRILVNGGGARVMIDDKLLRLSNDELESFLQGISASNVVRIEVIPIPPSKYDAEGGALINIVTKKIYEDGIKGTLRANYSQAQNGKGSFGSDLFIKEKALSLILNLNYREGKSVISESSYVNYFGNTNVIQSMWRVNSLRTRKTSSPSFKIYSSYDFGKRSSLTFNYFGSFNRNVGGVRNSQTNVFNNSMVIDSTMASINSSTGQDKSYSFSLGYLQKIDTLGRILTIDLDYIDYGNFPSQILNNIVYDKFGNTISNSGSNQHSSQNISVSSAKLDILHPLKTGSLLEYGIKYVSINTVNNFDFFNVLAGSVIFDSLKSNKFNYNENTFAGYFSFSKDIGKLSLKTGVRTELTSTKGISATLNSIIRNNYFNLFPSFFLSYRMNNRLSIGLSYSRRIERPEYWRLNPFESFITPYYSLKGNPELKPAYPTVLQTSFLFNHKISLNIYYNNTSDFFTNITKQINTTQSIQDNQVNIGRSISYGSNLSFPVNIVRNIWGVDCFFQGQIQNEKTNTLEYNFDYKNVNYYASVTNRFTVDKKRNIRAEISFWYNSSTIQGLYNIRPQWDASAALRLPVLKNMGSINLVVADLFYTQLYKINVTYPDQSSGFVERRDSRYSSITFTYKFGQKRAFKEKENRESGVDEESRRLK